jgi:hypothetical protein
MFSEMALINLQICLNLQALCQSGCKYQIESKQILNKQQIASSQAVSNRLAVPSPKF